MLLGCSLYTCIFLIIVSDSPATPAPTQGLEETSHDETKCNYEDLEESFTSLTQLAVTILYHSSKRLQLADDSIFISLSVNVLWCTLLTCKDELKRAISIPVENIITSHANRKKSFIVYLGTYNKMQNTSVKAFPPGLIVICPQFLQVTVIIHNIASILSSGIIYRRNDFSKTSKRSYKDLR